MYTNVYEKNRVKQLAKVLAGGGVMSLAKIMAQRQAVVLQNKKGKKGEDRNTEPEETDELDKDEEEGDGEEEGDEEDEEEEAKQAAGLYTMIHCRCFTVH